MYISIHRIKFWWNGNMWWAGWDWTAGARYGERFWASIPSTLNGDIESASTHPDYDLRIVPSDNEVKRLEGPPMIWQSLPITPDLRIFGLHILVQIWEQRLSNWDWVAVAYPPCLECPRMYPGELTGVLSRLSTGLLNLGKDRWIWLFYGTDLRRSKHLSQSWSGSGLIRLKSLEWFVSRGLLSPKVRGTKDGFENLDAFSSQSRAASEKEVGHSGKRQGRPEQVSIFPTLARRGTVSLCSALISNYNSGLTKSIQIMIYQKFSVSFVPYMGAINKEGRFIQHFFDLTWSWGG